MNILVSRQWNRDLEETVQALPILSKAAGCSVMVTGCTGLICSAVVDLLIKWNETCDNKITILASGRDFDRIRNRFAPYSDREWFRFVKYDASSTENALDFSCDYIIHGASNASPNMIVREPVETMLDNVIGMQYLLDFARRRKIRRVLFISSSEVYGKKDNSLPYREEEYGFIDLLSARNSYSVGKRAAETLCAAYADEYGVDSVIIRPGHIYGPTASRRDNRVSSAWAYDAADAKDIVMKSAGSQMRSYCYCLDSAAAILTALINGSSVQAYNISDPSCVISIRDMAEILTETAAVQLIRENADKTEKKGFNPMNNSSLDGTKLMELGWHALFTPQRGFEHTIEILKEIQEAPI